MNSLESLIYSKTGKRMSKQKLILISKGFLLLCVLGFSIPLFDETNGFGAIAYFLSDQTLLYKSIGVGLLAFCISVAASIIHSVTELFILKQSSKKSDFIDRCLFIVSMITTVFSFFAATHLPEEEVELTSGFSFIVLGLIASFSVYLYSTMLDENLSIQREEKRSYWLFALPAIVFYFGVMTFPSIFSVILSLTNYSGGNLFEKGALSFIGFKNYIKVFNDQYFYISLKNNLWIVLVSVFGQLPLGFLLAYVLTRGLVKKVDFFQTMIYLPCVMSTVVIGILFQTFFSAHGAWTEIMQHFNPNYQWSMNSHPIIPVLFVMLWMYTGTYLIIFMANLQKIDTQVIEAATIDGATEWQVLWHIIFPQLSGVFVTSAILAISGSLKSFDLIYVMTGGGPAKQTYVLSLYMFDKAFSGAADYPMANTISTIMVAISMVLIVIVKSLEKKFGAKED